MRAGGDLVHRNLTHGASQTGGAANEEGIESLALCGNHHVTAVRVWHRFAHACERPPTMEGVPGRGRHLIFTEWCWQRPWQVDGSSWVKAFEWTSNATGMPEARLHWERRHNMPLVNPTKPAEADCAS